MQIVQSFQLREEKEQIHKEIDELRSQVTLFICVSFCLDVFKIQGRNKVTRVNHDELATSLQQLILKALCHAFRILEEGIGDKSSSKPGEGKFASEGKLRAQIKGTRIPRNSLSLCKILPALKTEGRS